MKKYVGLILILLAIAFAVGCSDKRDGAGVSSGEQSSSADGSSGEAKGSSQAQETRYADGTYRGAYLDTGENQVTIEFTLKENKVESISFRGLSYQGVDYLADNADPATKAIAGQYQQLLDFLVGKDLSKALEKLYRPEEVAQDIEGFASATLRSGKVLSAIRDGLNRGVYRLPS